MSGPARAFPRAVASAFAATWRAIVGDAAVMLVLFGAGLLYSFVYPWPYSQQAVRRAPVAVVDQDQGRLSRQITRFVAASPAVDVVALMPDAAAAQDLLWRGRIAGLLVIPRGLQSDVLAGRVARVQVAGNGAWFLLDKAVLAGIAGAVGTVSAGIEIQRLEAAAASPGQAALQREPVALKTVALYNTQEGYGSSVVPAVGVLIVQQTALIAIALLVGTGRQAGRRPLHRGPAGFVGAWLAFTLAVLVNGAYWLGWVATWQVLPRAGHAGPVLAFLLLYAMAVSAFGLALGSLFRTREGGLQLLLFASIPMLFLAGSSWPASSLPPLLQALRWGLPSTAGIQGLLALEAMGATGAEVAREAMALAVLGALCFALGLWRWVDVAGRPAGGGVSAEADFEGEGEGEADAVRS